MPKRKPYARIAITLPEQDLAAADRLARALDRSRSWVVAEAIRRFAAVAPTTEPAMGASATGIASGADVPTTGLGAQRLAQLRRDLSLTPEQRVRAAEETLRLTASRERPRMQQVLTFDRYEDYLDWKRRRDATR